MREFNQLITRVSRPAANEPEQQRCGVDGLLGYSAPMFCPDGSIGLVAINLCTGSEIAGITVPACCDVVIGNCVVP
jgi:hypothetical protein